MCNRVAKDGKEIPDSIAIDGHIETVLLCGTRKPDFIRGGALIYMTSFARIYYRMCLLIDMGGTSESMLDRSMVVSPCSVVSDRAVIVQKEV